MAAATICMAAVRLLLQGGGCRSEERGAPVGVGWVQGCRLSMAASQGLRPHGGRKADAVGRKREDSPADHTRHTRDVLR